MRTGLGFALLALQCAVLLIALATLALAQSRATPGSSAAAQAPGPGATPFRLSLDPLPPAAAPRGGLGSDLWGEQREWERRQREDRERRQWWREEPGARRGGDCGLVFC